MSDVEKMWELQTVLTQLNDRERQMAVKPESFIDVDTEYQTSNDEMVRLQNDIDVLGKERRRVDGELADQQELLKKYQGTLMQVKNQQQYAAAWKEIDATRKHVKDLEESVLRNMTDADAIQSKLDERKGGFDELKSRYDVAHGEWQSSLGDLRGESEQLKAKVKQIEATMQPRLRDTFYRIYASRQQVAVAPVLGDTCTGCRTRIRPALAQQLKRGELIHCEGCSRILHLMGSQP